MPQIHHFQLQLLQLLVAITAEGVEGLQGRGADSITPRSRFTENTGLSLTRNNDESRSLWKESALLCETSKGTLNNSAAGVFPHPPRISLSAPQLGWNSHATADLIVNKGKFVGNDKLRLIFLLHHCHAVSFLSSLRCCYFHMKNETFEVS